MIQSLAPRQKYRRRGRKPEKVEDPSKAWAKWSVCVEANVWLTTTCRRIFCVFFRLPRLGWMTKEPLTGSSPPNSAYLHLSRERDEATTSNFDNLERGEKLFAFCSPHRKCHDKILNYCTKKKHAETFPLQIELSGQLNGSLKCFAGARVSLFQGARETL